MEHEKFDKLRDRILKGNESKYLLVKRATFFVFGVGLLAFLISAGFISYQSLNGAVKPNLDEKPPEMKFMNPPVGLNPQFITVAGVGKEAQGAGIAFTNLDSNSRPEMILMAYNNPDRYKTLYLSGDNTFDYKIGWNLSGVGVATSWGPNISVAGVGKEGQGAGLAITNLDSNSRPEMILMAYDNPVGNNSFRYKIGWNLNAAGVTTSWGPIISVAGVGHEGQGAGIAISNFDSDSRPEMILMAYDNPVGNNSFRYKIGWNLNARGVATHWSNFVQTPGVGHEGQGVGYEGQGAGVAITNLDSNSRPEMIFMAYDNPTGENSFRFKIGWNINGAGVADIWSNGAIPGVGHEGQGADIAVYNLDNNPAPELIFMAYDNPVGENTFRYKILFNGGDDSDGRH